MYDLEDVSVQSNSSESRSKPSLNKNRNWSAYPSAIDESKKTNHVEKVVALLDNVQDLIDDTVEVQLDAVPDWCKPDVEIQFYAIEEGAVLDHEPVGPIIRASSVGKVQSTMKQFSKLTLSQLHHYALLGAYINDLYRAQVLIDVIIHVNEASFAVNRHALSCHSELFASIFIDSTVPPFAVTDVTLIDLEPEMFQMFVHFVYFGELLTEMGMETGPYVCLHSGFTHERSTRIDDSIVTPLIELCDILESETMRAKVLSYCMLRTHFTFDTAIKEMSKSPNSKAKLAATYTIVINFEMLMKNPSHFKSLDVDDMKAILSSDDLNVKTELDAFWAVLFWIMGDQDKRVTQLDSADLGTSVAGIPLLKILSSNCYHVSPNPGELMRCVRFTTMSTLELMDCARASNMLRVSSTCKLLLVNAHWACNARELGITDPLLLQLETPRNSLADEDPFVPTVQDFDERYLVYKKLGTKSVGGGDSAGDSGADEKSESGKKKFITSVFKSFRKKKTDETDSSKGSNETDEMQSPSLGTPQQDTKTNLSEPPDAVSLDEINQRLLEIQDDIIHSDDDTTNIPDSSNNIHSDLETNREEGRKLDDVANTEVGELRMPEVTEAPSKLSITSSVSKTSDLMPSPFPWDSDFKPGRRKTVNDTHEFRDGKWRRKRLSNRESRTSQLEEISQKMKRSLLDQPNSEMSQHLAPVLKPKKTNQDKKNLRDQATGNLSNYLKKP